jgi:hypothetical protein
MAPKTNNVFRQVDGKVQKVPVELPALGPNDVLIKITHSGLCHTDVFMIDYGIALGHEGVGIVEEIGSAVTNFKIGERAGGGYLRNVSHFVIYFPVFQCLKLKSNTLELWEVQVLPFWKRDLVLFT